MCVHLSSLLIFSNQWNFHVFSFKVFGDILALSVLKKIRALECIFVHSLCLYILFSSPPFGCMWAESLHQILLLLSTIILSSLHNSNHFVLESSLTEEFVLCWALNIHSWSCISPVVLLISLDYVFQETFVYLVYVFVLFAFVKSVCIIRFWSVILCHSILNLRQSFAVLRCFLFCYCTVDGDMVLTLVL